MPAVSKARTPSIAQLARELGYASKPTLQRHLARIDELGPQIDPEQLYPHDWIVFRVTGYRPDIDNPDLIPGEALRGDLSALAESISEAAGLTPDDIPAEHETINSLAARWGVSRKTIERYRRLGLIARRIDLGSGRRKVVFLRPTVEWFETMNQERLGNAARFDRIPQHEVAKFDRWAHAYRARLGWSCSQCAARIAQRTGHSHEGVRKVLIRLDTQRDRPVFNEPPPAREREGRLVLRATMRGIEPGQIAKREKRRVNSINRAARKVRTRLLRELGLPAQEIAPEHLQTVLEAGPVQDITHIEGEHELTSLIERMREHQPSVAYEEHAQAVAIDALRKHCGWRIAQIDEHAPGAVELDEIETDLRYITMIKATLLRSRLEQVLSAIESRLGGAIDTLTPARAAHLVLGGISAASGALDRYDPAHGGRIAAPIGLAVNRFVASQPDVAQPVDSGKASRRISAGYPVDDWTASITPWQRWLDPDRRISRVLDRLEERDRIVLMLRFGLGEHRPISRAHLAEVLGTTRVHGVRFERAAIMRARNLVRDDGAAE
ncbi:MAG: hypothetical protein ACF8MF_13360 [Phycisphaerales bacterium JB052]